MGIYACIQPSGSKNNTENHAVNPSCYFHITWHFYEAFLWVFCDGPAALRDGYHLVSVPSAGSV